MFPSDLPGVGQCRGGQRRVQRRRHRGGRMRWTSTRDAPSDPVTASTSSSDNGSVTYTVAANPGTTSRPGTLTIGSNSFSISPAGTTCAPTLSASSATSRQPERQGTSPLRSQPAAAGRPAATPHGSRPAPLPAAAATARRPMPVAANTWKQQSRTGTVTIAAADVHGHQAGTTCTSTLSAPSAEHRGSRRDRLHHRHSGNRFRLNGQQQRHVDHDQRRCQRQR